MCKKLLKLRQLSPRNYVRARPVATLQTLTCALSLCMYSAGNTFAPRQATRGTKQPQRATMR